MHCKVYKQRQDKVQPEADSSEVSHLDARLDHTNLLIDHASDHRTSHMSELCKDVHHEGRLDEQVHIACPIELGAEKFILCATEDFIQ